MSKIFFIIPTLKQGGSERVISELANNFSERGIEVHIVLLVKSEDFFKVSNKITIHRLNFENKNIFQRCVCEIKVAIALRKLLKNQRPDATLSFGEKYNVLTLICGISLNINIFVSDRSNPRNNIPKTIDFLRHIMYKRATGIIAQTELGKSILEKNTGNKNIKVIPNPVKEINEFPEFKKEKIILNVGRLIPEKGQKYLLESFSKLNHDGWKLIILGDGPLRNDLDDLARKLNIKQTVFFLGAGENVDEWLTKASIFAFSSISEGFPNALIEAMSAGLPCVSFDCDTGPRDIIQNEVNGILVPVFNISAFTDKLQMLVNNENMRISIGKNAKDYSTKFLASEITQKFLDFLLCKEDNLV